MAAKQRLSKDDWVSAGFNAFAIGGLGAVAVEPLAASLGTTKGSFYWHFSGRDELIDAIIVHWQSLTENIITDLWRQPDPRERLRELFRTVLDHWAWWHSEPDLLGRTSDPHIGGVVEQVTRRRLAFMTECFKESGLDPDAAADAAFEAYSLWIGMLTLASAVPGVVPAGQRREQLLDSILDLLETLL